MGSNNSPPKDLKFDCKTLSYNEECDHGRLSSGASNWFSFTREQASKASKWLAEYAASEKPKWIPQLRDKYTIDGGTEIHMRVGDAAQFTSYEHYKWTTVNMETGGLHWNCGRDVYRPHEERHENVKVCADDCTSWARDWK